MIDLSVIIVNWNTKDFLLDCLASIFEKIDKITWEVIIVDNGSQDGSVNEVKVRFPSIDLIGNDRNFGFAKATNQAIRRSSGEYILLLNPDTQVKEGAVHRMFSFMNQCQQVGIAGPQLLNGDGTKQNSIANVPSLATELLNKSLLRWMFPRRFPGKGRNYLEPIEVESVIGACMMVRRDAMEHVGLLDEDYFLFLEETDWCYRMKKAGWNVYHIPEAEVYHHQGKSAEQEKKKAKLEYYRSRYHFFKKNRGGLQWLMLRVGLMIKLWIELISMTVACFFTLFSIKKLRDRLSIYAYLTWWHLKGCPEGMGLKSDR